MIGECIVLIEKINRTTYESEEIKLECIKELHVILDTLEGVAKQIDSILFSGGYMTSQIQLLVNLDILKAKFLKCQQEQIHQALANNINTKQLVFSNDEVRYLEKSITTLYNQLAI